MARSAFEDKIVARAKDIRALIQRRNRLEHDRDDFVSRAQAMATEIASLKVQIEEARAALVNVDLSED